MPRFRQRGRPDSAIPMGAPGSYSESSSDDQSSKAVYNSPSSDEHPSPSHTSRRTLGQIVQEASLCTVSLQAFDRDDPAFDQLNERLHFLKDEYQKIQKGDRDNVRGHGHVGEYVQEYFDYNQQDYEEHYDEVPEVGNNIQSFMRPSARVGSKNGSFVGAVPPLSNIRSPTKALNQIAGGMPGRYRESRMPRKRNPKTWFSSYTDTVAPVLVEDNIAPFTDKDGNHDAEQYKKKKKKKKWSTVKVKNGDKKSEIAYVDRSELQVENQNPRFQSSVPWVKASDVKKAEWLEAEERVSPKLKIFDEFQRQLREHDVLPSYPYSFRRKGYREPAPGSFASGPTIQQSEVASSFRQPEHQNCFNGWLNCSTCAACTAGDVTTAVPANNAPDSKPQDAHSGVSAIKVYSMESSLLRNDIKIIDVPTRSDVSKIEEHTGSPVLKDGVAAANTPTRKQDQSTTTVAEDKKQVTTKMDRIHERPCVAYDDLNDSDSEIIPVIPKLGHPTKPSSVKTATGFASSKNTAAPDVFMVDEFLEVAEYKFTRDEAFEILRMCGANLVAAISMYHNAISPEHLRQMLRAWLAPLENAEFQVAARFYTDKVDNQGKPWGVSSEEVGVSGDRSQRAPAVMDARDAFAILGLEAYLYVDPATLLNGFESQLAWQKSFPQARERLQQAYDTIIQHQTEKDCWENVIMSFTKAMDKKPLRWKTEDVKTKRATIADASNATVDDSKLRFKQLGRSDEKLNPKKEGESREQQQEDTVKAASVRTATPEIGYWSPPSYCEACDNGNYDSDHDCEADRAAVDGNYAVHDPQPIWSFSDVPASAPEPKAPVSTAYAVTYWATIESGDKVVHIPVDSSNISGPEKAIIEGSTGMKKVWKWVQEKGLSDRVGLQDAFDLTTNMHGKDEDDESVVEELKAAKDNFRTSSAWGSTPYSPTTASEDLASSLAFSASICGSCGHDPLFCQCGRH